MVTLRKRRSTLAARDPHGTAMLLHRSIGTLRLPRDRIAVGLGIAIVFTALLLIARPWIGQAWAETLVRWMRALALPGTFQLPDLKDVGVLGVPVPSIDVRPGHAGLQGAEVQAVACVAGTHLFTGYVFPFDAWKPVAPALVTLLFLFVLAPLQYASHAALLPLPGAMAMPRLYLLFGMMLPILGLVALYRWAMSWDGSTGRPPVAPA